MQDWKTKDVERYPSCFADLMVDRPFVWLLANLVMLGFVAHLVYTKGWVEIIAEKRTDYLMRHEESTQNYQKELLVENQLLEEGLMDEEYPL